MQHRRFIAGATCPRCGALDRIVVDADTRRRECVACGFSEAQPEAGSAERELPTRVTRGSARRRDTPEQVINIVDSQKLRQT